MKIVNIPITKDTTLAEALPSTAEPSTHYKIMFDGEFDVDTFADKLRNVLDWSKSIDSNSSSATETNIRQLDTNLKIVGLNMVLEDTDVEDIGFVMNIFSFIKTYNTFADSFFEHENVYAKSIVEFVDIRMGIIDNIQKMINTIRHYYLSIMQSCHVFEIFRDTKLTQIPNLYSRILFLCDFVTLSGISSQATDNIESNNTPVVEHALTYVQHWSRTSSLSDTLLNEIMRTCQEPQ